MLAHLHLADFRNYVRAELELTPGLTVLHGDNGQGKTNLIEAVMLLSSGTSSRPGGAAALVRTGAETALVRAAAERQGRRSDIAIEIPRRGRSRAAVNGDVVRRRSDALGHVRAVLFSPDDLALAKGGPAGRRDLLDQTTALLRPAAADRAAGWERVLRQRASLLRSLHGRGPRPPTLDVWDDNLVRHGMEVWADRLDLLRVLAPRVEATYGELAPGQGSLRLSYRLSWGEDLAPGSGADESAFRAALAAAAREELERGLCLVGPHRDDLVLTLDDRDARVAASQGEARTIALSLRLAVHALAAERDGPPTLLLDDVVSELDPGRAAALLRRLPDCQTLITTAEPPERLPLPVAPRVVRVSAGTLTDG